MENEIRHNFTDSNFPYDHILSLSLLYPNTWDGRIPFLLPSLNL